MLNLLSDVARVPCAGREVYYCAMCPIAPCASIKNVELWSERSKHNQNISFCYFCIFSTIIKCVINARIACLKICNSKVPAVTTRWSSARGQRDMFKNYNANYCKVCWFAIRVAFTFPSLLRHCIYFTFCMSFLLLLCRQQAAVCSMFMA